MAVLCPSLLLVDLPSLVSCLLSQVSRLMFTGIIRELGTVERITRAQGITRLAIRAPGIASRVQRLESVSVNGVCLTVTARNDSSFAVDVVPETLRRSNLGLLKPGDPVNLERPLAVSDRLGGHIVQGHVDGTGTVESIATEGDALLVKVKASPSLMRYVVDKGFIAVDGTSLTVVNCGNEHFVVTIIPFTRDNTVFGALGQGDTVNLEVDILAKYVERLSSFTRKPLEPEDEL